MSKATLAKTWQPLGQLCTTRETPPEAPSLFNPLAHEETLATSSRPRKKSQEDLCLSRPSPTNFHAKHHETRTCAEAHKLQVRPLFSAAGCDQGDTILFSCSSVGLTVRVQGADQSGVNGKLSASEEGESLCHHFKSPSPANCTKSRSRTITLVDTLPPASRQMRAATLSKA